MNEENITALFSIKGEDPELEKFSKGHFGDTEVFWWDAKEQRKGGNGKEKKCKKSLTRIKWLRFTNGFIDTFLESSSDEDKKSMLFITLETVR